MKNMPGFFFIYILMFCILGITIMGFILGWVYSDFSPRNEPIIKYEGSINLNDSVYNNFERHSNYYDFDYFFMFWDRDKKEWVNDFPEYNFVIYSNN